VVGDYGSVQRPSLEESWRVSAAFMHVLKRISPSSLCPVLLQLQFLPPGYVAMH